MKEGERKLRESGTFGHLEGQSIVLWTEQQKPDFPLPVVQFENGVADTYSATARLGDHDSQVAEDDAGEGDGESERHVRAPAGVRSIVPSPQYRRIEGCE
jgi:hypothetical protein